MNKELNNLADLIIKQLSAEGFTIQRYDSCTTDSIYLKLDYGVCNSIRISSHPGKAHLKYRYNIGTFISEYKKEKDTYDRYYYRADKVKNLIKRIIDDRNFKKSRYGEERYAGFMQKNKLDKAGTCGFWEQAVLVS